MKLLFATLLIFSIVGFAGEMPSANPMPKIPPGKVIIPLEKMQPPSDDWVSLDLATRTAQAGVDRRPVVVPVEGAFESRWHAVSASLRSPLIIQAWSLRHRVWQGSGQEDCHHEFPHHRNLKS